ncbi:CC0125/CC1285 family lipoprotein [Sinimarinibacterium thermocellulolyticum]|uniref:Lipoprotein n=1 Tax=Sinimarinibacterium thermocellulolyticum TaxID=3170016 RepID=A0ABV2A5M8_9GAMM
MTRMLIRFALALSLGAALGACVSATPYQPRDRGYGYAEQKLESNRFRVSFAGNGATPRETVENYLLYRAAELTLAQGYDYFVIAARDTETDVRYQQTFSGFPGFGYYYFYPYFGASVSTTQSETRYAAQADVVMFKGEKNSADTRAFNAAELKANLEPLIVRPQAS